MNDEEKRIESAELVQSEKEFSLEDYLYILNRRKWIIIVIVIAVLVAGYFYTNSKERIYASTCEIYANSDSKGNTFAAQELMQIAGMGNVSAVSQEMIAKSISNPDSLQDAFNQLTAEEKQKGFKNHISPTFIQVTEFKSGTRIYDIKVKSYDPEVASKFANLLAKVYFKGESEVYNDYSDKAKIQMQEEMAKIHSQLDEARDQLVALKQKTGIYSIETDIASKIGGKYTTEDELRKLNIELHALETSYTETKKQIHQLPKKIKTNTTQNVSATTAIVERIDQLSSEKAQLLQKYTPSSPEVKEIENKINFEKNKLNNSSKDTDYTYDTYTLTDNPQIEVLKNKLTELEIEIASKKDTISKTKEYLDQNDKNMKNIPDQESEYLKLTEYTDMLKENLSVLQSNYYTLSFNTSNEYNIGRVLSSAIPNRTPVEPNIPKSMIMFLIVGLVLGGFAALIADEMDNIIYDNSSMRKITTLPCLSRIPMISTGEKLQIGKLTGHSNFLEAFRIFRNNIMLTELQSEYHGIDKNKIFAITGPDVKQGKSTVAANLAIAVALDGNKVLLIDADLRKPNVAKFFNVPNDVGYTTLVKGITTLEESVKPSNVDGLDLLTSGPLPPNPTEFLNSEENRQWVQKLQNEYDIIIYDTSPCSFISDAQIVTTFVDAVVLVITVKSTRIPTVRTAIEQLNLVKAPLIGYVLNKVQAEKHGREYYYNYYYYASDDKD